MWSIEPLTSRDAAEAEALWRSCFEDGDAFVDWWFANRFAPERALGVRVDGRWAAMLHMPAYPLMLRGRRFRAACLAGVATEPVYRGQGLAGALLDQSVRRLAQSGAQMAFLYPTVSARVYRRSGFETAWARQGYALDAAQLRPLLERAQSLLARPLRREDAPAMAACYARAMADKEGYVPRDAQDCLRRLEETERYGGASLAVFAAPDAIAAYALYKREGERLDVEELCFARERDRDALLAASVAQGAPQLHFWLPHGDPLWLTLDDTRAVSQTGSGGMLRVLDAQALLDVLPRHRLSAPLHLAIEDPLLPQNHATFRLAAGEPVAPCDRQADLRIDVRALAQLATGIADAGTIVGERLNGSAREVSRLFPPQCAVLFECY